MLSCPGCISMVTVGWGVFTPTQHKKQHTEGFSHIESKIGTKRLPNSDKLHLITRDPKIFYSVTLRVSQGPCAVGGAE